MKKILFSFGTLLFYTVTNSQCPGTGSINFQRWNNISGGDIINLTSNVNYPNNPTSVGTQPSFEMPNNIGNNIGVKMYGYLCPPTTGAYIFWIAADNSGELWLSTSVNATGKIRIAYNNSPVASREWNRYATQKSIAIQLTAGQKYYVEALMKEATGKDNFAVGWAKPGQGTAAPSEVIPGVNLSVNGNGDTEAPSAPTNLNSSNITANSFTLSWTASTDNVDVTGYDVYSDGIKINTTLITSTTFNITSLAANTTYSITVKARDAAGNEATSTALPVTTSPAPDIEAPSAPANLAASNVTTNSFTLSWTASIDNVAVTGYDVYNDGIKINTTLITSTTFNITSLAANTTYSITVRARDAAGNEATSTALPVTTSPAPDTEAPSAPANLAASNVTTNSFTLSWTASTDNVAVTGYDVYSDGVKINTSPVTNTYFNMSGLSANTTYSMTIAVKDAAGNISTSNPYFVTTLPVIPLSPILTLPISTSKTIINQSNIIIENLRFENINGIAISIFSSSNIIIRNCFFNRMSEEAISIENSSNITIENCLFNDAQTGVYALKCQTVKVRYNQFVNMKMRLNGSRGQFIQFNEVTGTGNLIESNKGENFPGESNPEDLISVFKSTGLSSSRLFVRNNILRGGGPSTSGSGIVVGDHGGNYINVENNTLLDPGQAGIAVAGGRNISILNNKIYARQQPFTNNPLYVWNQSGTNCSHILVRGNRVNWTDKNGNLNNGWNAGNCSNTIFESPTTISLAEMNVPDHLIDMITPEELLMIRGVILVKTKSIYSLNQ